MAGGDMTPKHVPQPVRYSFLLVELAALLAVNRFAQGSWLPGADTAGLWFYAALFGLVLGQRLDTPFFTTPAAAVLYAIPSLFALLQVPEATWATGSTAASTCRALLAAWIGLVLCAASGALWFQNMKQLRLQQIAISAKQVSAALGNPRTFFSIILLLTLLSFPPPDVFAALAIAAVWAATVPTSLLDALFVLSRRLRLALALGAARVKGAGIDSFQSPGILTIKAQTADAFSHADVVCFRDPTAGMRLGYVLGSTGRHEGALFRAVDIGALDVGQTQAAALSELLEEREVTGYPKEGLTGAQAALARDLETGCIGFVAPESDIGRLLVEITSDRDLTAGQLVTTSCGQQKVHYQLSNGLTKEEAIQQKSTNGYVIAHAKSVGVWSAEENKFKPVPWVASPNAPVMLVSRADGNFHPDSVGTFPSTDFPIRLANLPQLVTHNTAILGILGVGKSTLAMELLERIVQTGCKAIVLDLTDQYAVELAPLLDNAYQTATITALQAVGPPGRGNVRQNVEDGGSRPQFAQAMEGQIRGFMAGPERILVLNPASFEVWRQDSRPFQGNASMASLTSCEVTHIVSDAALRVVQGMGRSDAARLCLVYEEAHSLVPEWNAAVSEGDRTATNGTSRAILQGRKYGFGCFLITQRTASVTKTILNQCNTVFAMRSFDDTSREFLSNYIGREYATLLPNLPERHAILFGRGSSCENPVHVQLNDRAAFVRHFRGEDLV
jgi:uncharacterized protein